MEFHGLFCCVYFFTQSLSKWIQIRLIETNGIFISSLLFLDFYFRKGMKVFMNMNKNYKTHIIAIAQVICIWALLGLIWYLL